MRVISRLRAPVRDGELLAIPPLDEANSLFSANADALDRSDVRLAGTSLRDFRARAILEALEAGQAYMADQGEAVSLGSNRILAGGHQPEFSHPGVWIKNFALDRLARSSGRVSLQIIVDSDLTKSTTLPIPAVHAEAKQVRLEHLYLVQPPQQIPVEEYDSPEISMLRNVGESVNALTRTWAFQPVFLEAWPRLISLVQDRIAFGEAISRLRRHYERSWGISLLDLPVSRLAETSSFKAFTSEIITNLPVFREAYNRAICSYRSQYRLRSKNHPAKELEIRSNWIEAPFWIWHGKNPQRERLFIRSLGGSFEFAIGNRVLDGRTITRLPEGGWKIRPRALILTLFLRLCVADGFIHGIGGGKYDEVTDSIIQSYYNLPAPRYAIVSGTLRLPLPTFPSTPEKLHRIQRQIRDLQWNPQTCQAVRAELSELVAEKQRLMQLDPGVGPQRRTRFRKLQSLTRVLRSPIEPRLAEAQDQLRDCQEELLANKILKSREFSWLLFPKDKLQLFLQSVP